VRRQRLVTASVFGAVAAVLSTLTVATAPLASQSPAAANPGSAAGGSVVAPGRAFAAREPRRPPLVVAHRGASAYRAEHTLDSYRLAVTMGADFIEADLVVTRDGALVARHENELSTTTDVAAHPEFADRRQTKLINGAPVTGWFTEDFGLGELRALRAVERHGASQAAGVGVADPPPVPELQEIIDLARRESASRHRTVGLYLELKLPGYFRSIGLAPEPRLADTLRRNGLTGQRAPVFVESFEPESLRTVHRLADVPLIQLIWGRGLPDDAATAPDALLAIRGYAIGIGIDRGRLWRLGHTDPGAAYALVRTAHGYGLEVHVYTFADNAVSRPVPVAARRGSDPAALADALAEYRSCFALGVDAVFTDNPDTAVVARG
jgi:glycerophosphoryl diester phosphodiesterase